LGNKHPGQSGIQWGEDWIKIGRPTWPDLARVFDTSTFPAQGLWVATGQVSKRVVLDLDGNDAVDKWRELIGDDIFDRALKVSTGRDGGTKFHLHFRIADNDNRPWPGHSDNSMGYDFRGDGGGVVLPPSRHRSGLDYKWVDGELLDAPECLRKENLPWSQNGKPRVTIADLARLPSDDAGRGDNWVTQLIGKLSAVAHGKDGLTRDDAAELAVAIDAMSDQPIGRNVVLEKLNRIWRLDSEERANKGFRPPDISAAEPQADESPAENYGNPMSMAPGGLFPRTDGKIGYATRRDFVSKKGKEVEIVTFSDFEVTATSVNTSNGETIWVVDLLRDDGVIFGDIDLPSKTLISTSALRAWAAGYQCSLFFTDDRDAHGSPGVRLQRFMRSQNPVDCRVIDHLGWDDQAAGFVTYEGVITKDNITINPKVRPSRSLANNNLVDHFYGHARPEHETRSVLREVLTFHDETFTSVFTSWMVAGVIKGQLVRKSSLFPIFLVQAASESGKSKGFAQLIHQLFGNRTKEGGIGTMASIRNAMTAHRGAPVHIDDADNVDNIKELLRQATVEGAADKVGEDKLSTVKSRLLAPVWISMEGSSLLEDKALSDRIVTMGLPNPKGRKSKKDPSKPQWDDVLDMMDRYNTSEGLTVFSGALVQLILKYAEARLPEFSELRTRSNSASSGRHADKMAVMRVGARILADITGDDTHIKRVDEWSTGVKDTGDENALTMKLIPEVLTVIGPMARPIRADRAPHYGVPTPVLIGPAPGSADQADHIWVHTENLAVWWNQHRRGKVSDRTETAAALEDQAARLGMVGGKAGERGVDWTMMEIDRANSDSGVKRSKARYRRLPNHIAQSILTRVNIEVGAEEVRDPSKLTRAQAVIIDRSSLN
jgi:hypothetical protein